MRNKKKKVKKTKLVKISRLKAKAWAVFSQWIRKRGADANGMTVCVTCGRSFFWKDLHAGHFIHGSTKLTYLDEQNVHSQCGKCNTWFGGKLVEYSEFMRKMYGQETIDRLLQLRHTIWKPTREELEAVVLKYAPPKEAK